MEKPQKIVEIIKKRENLVDEIPELFILELERIQNALYRDIYDFLSDLKTKNGKIQNIAANKQMAIRLRDQIRTFLRQNRYYLQITEFGKKYDDLISTSREYYNAIDLPSAFTERDLETLSKIRLDDLSFLRNADQQVINQVYSALIGSIYRETTFRELLAVFRETINDTATPGILKKYAATHAKTAYATFDRKIQNIKSAEIGLDHYLFSGGLIKDSRQFCRDRAGQVFTTAQINDWESQSWTGKNSNGSVWDYLGGWNCQHILTPTTADFAETLAGLYK